MSDMPSCAHLNVLYAPKDNADGTQSDAWACRDCLHPFWPQNLAVATHLAILRERNVGDSSKAARSEVVENTGDGSESAGLREGVREMGAERKLILKLADSLRWYMRMASEAELSQFGVYAQAKDALEAVDALAAQTEDYGLKQAIKDAEAMAERVLAAPAISHPPTQGEREKFEKWYEEYIKTPFTDTTGKFPTHMWSAWCAALAQPPSLPPSRADLGGDRIRDFALEFAKAWMDAHHTIYNDVMLGSLANKFDEVLKPYQTGESK